MKHNWYELWADESGEIPYVLLVRPRGEIIEIYDFRKECTVRTSGSYEELKMWLLEDEYRLVEGRMEEDSYWE